MVQYSNGTPQVDALSKGTDILRDYLAIGQHAHTLLTEENILRLASEGLTSDCMRT